MRNVLAAPVRLVRRLLRLALLAAAALALLVLLDALLLPADGRRGP